jgi:hypothetical protein
MKNIAAVVASTAARVVQTSCSLVSPSSSPAQACAPDPLEVFRLRCDARAHLYVEGLLDLHDAVDELQASAERDGLVVHIGQDAVQVVMGTAFAARRWPQPLEELQVIQPSSEYRTPSSTIAAFWNVVQSNDPVRLRAWLINHPADGPALRRLLERR